ncbi:MAG: hypothetical protein IPO92_05285 [Saprospiraceae bacterium]|nr:hypothetical protein [Saprospiraceae bacterium]
MDFHVTIYFWSQGVVIGSCETIVTPTDPGHFCPPTLITVAGYLKTENNQKVANAIVNMEGSEFAPSTSNMEGRYVFTDLPSGGTYNVIPFKNDKPMDGVSTLDLIYLQKHILRTEILNSPYKMIAGDINKDNKITAADIVQLRKMILGIYSSFPDNTSWRMVDAKYQFPDPKDPFMTPFAEKYHIDNLSTNMSINWMGIKTGDLNGSYVSNIVDQVTESRSADFSFNILNGQSVFGENIIPVTASKSQDLNGFQIAIKMIDAQGVSIESRVLSVEDYNYHFANGYLVISWHDQRGISVKEGDRLFDIHMNGSGKAQLSDIIMRDQSIIKSEIYDASNRVRTLGINFINAHKDLFDIFWAIHLTLGIPKPALTSTCQKQERLS